MVENITLKKQKHKYEAAAHLWNISVQKKNLLVKYIYSF